MSASVFISYSRRNKAFAERLFHDLTRAGLSVWLDVHQIPLGGKFATCIDDAIHAITDMVLIASPEAADSAWVCQREVQVACERGRTVIPVRVAGNIADFPDSWRELNMPQASVQDYWATARQLACQLGAPNPTLPSVATLLTDPLWRGRTVAEAAQELAGASTVTDRKTGVTFAKLPVAPTAYCNLSLLAPLDVTLGWPVDLGILLNFTSDRTGTRSLQVIEHWAEQVRQPWLLMLEGPVNAETNQYELRTDRPHEWADCIAAGVRVLEEFARDRSRVGYYFNCPVALTFEIGLRTKVMNGPRRVFHFDHSGEYHLASNSWPA